MNLQKKSVIKSKGFTLIELLIAITIVAILSTIAVSSYISSQAAARDGKRISDLQDIKDAIYLMKTSAGKITDTVNNANGFFWNAWANAADNATYGMNASGDESSMNKNLVRGGYLKIPVKDPKCPSTGLCTGWDDYFISVVDDSTFTISARLERAKTMPDLGCVPQTGYNYCVSQ